MSIAPTTTQPAFVTAFRNFEVQGDELTLQHKQAYNDLAAGVNQRDIGFYDLTEIVDGQTWFGIDPTSGAVTPQNKRYNFRQVYQVPAIPSGGSDTIMTNITGADPLTFTFINGVVQTDEPDQRPIPYASVTLDANIEINVNYAANPVITIKVGATSPNVLSGTVTLEYLKN